MQLSKKQVASLAIFLGISLTSIQAQTIGEFNSVVAAPQTQNLVLPATHTFQRLIRTGDALTAGGTLGASLDFTGYVPIAGSSKNGYVSVSSETFPAECAILNVTYNELTKMWEITNSGKVELPSSNIGLCAAFCSGTVTPTGTIMVGEEAVLSIDGNNDSYEDIGWLIEIDPATRKVINQDGIAGVDKLWAMGHQKHENVTVNSTGTVAYWGADESNNGFLYKFELDEAGKYGSGKLYVLKIAAGTENGAWIQIPNVTKAERNNTVAASIAVGATNFNRIEDVEIGPDGKIYFASTATGTVFRLTDAGPTVSNLEPFVSQGQYVVDGTPVTFEWPDNLAFDGEGNLWVLQDGGQNHIWVVGADHTTATPAIRVFANTPAGSEPTGISFSPDYQFMFISIQRPNPSNTSPQYDAGLNEVVFNQHSTLVIARKENLGSNVVLPLHFIDLQLSAAGNSITLNWKVEGQQPGTSYFVERSTDGLHYKQIATVPSTSSSATAAMRFTDAALPLAATVFYRIKGCDAANSCRYSNVKSGKVSNTNGWFKLFPSPVKNRLQVTLHPDVKGTVEFKIFDAEARQVYAEIKKNITSQEKISIATSNLADGSYILQVQYNGVVRSEVFVKQ